MFKKSYIAAVLCFAAVSASGQGFQFGVFFNPAITWLRSDVKDVTRENARAGFDLGMTADFYFSRNYAFATGISLFNTGGTLKYADGIANFRTGDGNVQIEKGGTVKYKMQYIKIPLAVKFKTHAIGNLVYFANLGLDPMVRATTRADVAGVKNAIATKETKLFNLGWHFGLGGQYSLGEESSIYGGLSFMSTFIDITRASHDRITSGNLILHIGVMF